jgi:long-chain acyl-CoA synthetase
MEIDLELYRHEVRASIEPLVRLSAIDIAPDYAEKTLVFLHGFGGQALQWKYQLNRFSISNRVIALDQRGHGLSDKPRSGFTMLDLISDLEIAMDSLGVADPFVLAGHSFGGAVATEFAVRQPRRVSHLILIASAGEYQLNPLYRLLLRLPASTLQMLAPFTRQWLGAPPQVMKAWYTGSLSSWNGWHLFREIRVPTLVLRGHMDVVFKKPLYEEVARAIPTAEEVDVGASGHMVMLERREAVNRAIARFVEGGERSWSLAETSPEETRRASLVKERPWLPYYDDNVPSTIAIPRVAVQSLLRSAARRFPRRTALIFQGNRISYRRLNQEASRFANLLRSMGVSKGDRVMLILPNLPQLIIGFYGALKAGAVVVFTLPTTEPAELVRQIQDSSASILVTLTQFDPLIAQLKDLLRPDASSSLKHIIFTDPGEYLPLARRLVIRLSPSQHQAAVPPPRLNLEPLDVSIHIYNRILYGQSRKTDHLDILPGDLAVIMYTGGTTANPKGVMLSHRNLVANALQTRHWIPDAREGQECFLCVVPFSHSYGLTAALNVPIALGATLVLIAQFKVDEVLKSVKKYRPTIFPGVPRMFVSIKDFPEVRKYGIASIKACISGSASLPVEVQEAFEKLTRGRLVEGYGLTEASPVTHANPLAGLRKLGAIGVPLPSTEARIVDLNRGKTPVPVGQIGELAVRGPQVMLGYWQAPRATRKVLSSDGWLLTGDVAQQDSEGYFRIISRKADMWYPTKPGVPAFPRDVEEVLFEVPQVKEAAVVAIAGQPVAFVIALKDRPTAEALIAYCKRRLPPELVPRVVIFVEDFPRTFIGKVLRRELARRFQESRLGLGLDASLEGTGV